ncbi:hypothetical protein DOY81_008938 [Sarcophaga bullata]|nr:hypothetical protein DOY81_008938 [Sarcophaga bullata]
MSKESEVNNTTDDNFDDDDDNSEFLIYVHFFDAVNDKISECAPSTCADAVNFLQCNDDTSTYEKSYEDALDETESITLEEAIEEAKLAICYF